MSNFYLKTKMALGNDTIIKIETSPLKDSCMVLEDSKNNHNAYFQLSEENLTSLIEMLQLAKNHMYEK